MSKHANPQRSSQDVANLRPGEEKKAPRSAFQRAEAETVMFASAKALPLEYAEPFAPPADPRQAFGTRIRSKRLSRIILGLALLMQAALTLRMHNTAFEDEALYLYVGHLEIAHILHGAALQGDYPSYFSGAPVLYPVLGAAADNLGGLAAARAVSLLAMLGATALLYSLTRKLFNERVAVYAAVVFSVAEPTLFLGNLATYDATTLFLLALAAWLVVHNAESRWPGYLLAAPVLVLAVATKYAGLLFVPCVIVLAGLAAWPHRGGKAAVGRPVLLGLATGALLAGTVDLAGADYWRGVTSTTLQRTASTASPASLVWDCVQWIGLPLALAVLGAVAYTVRPTTEMVTQMASAGGRLRRAALGVALAGSALLAPANQIRIDTFVSLQKHVGFGLLFAAPIAGVGLAFIIGDHFRRTQIAIAVWGAALALGMTQANDLVNAWPDTSVSNPELARFLEPGAHYLVEVPEVPIYYLRDNPEAEPSQFTSTFNFTYVSPQGETLNGAAAYAAAIKAGYFRMVVFDNSVTPATDDVISRAVAVNPDYRLAVVVPETTGGREYIWVKSDLCDLWVTFCPRCVSTAELYDCFAVNCDYLMSGHQLGVWPSFASDGLILLVCTEMWCYGGNYSGGRVIFMSESTAIIEAMRHAVPPGRVRLTDADTALLRELTAGLMVARPDAASEYQRFLDIARRGLCLPRDRLAVKLRDATILVTGGTGCIGSALMGQLAAHGPARLVSVSRGVTGTVTRQEDAEYLNADVTDRAAIDRVITAVKPDIVFHVAAQRSPGLAETEVRRTVSTNVLGARNVLAAASGAGAGQVVIASTGKALRPYSPEVYTASKRAAEWVAVTAAANGDMACSAARFTHVIDNSIIHRRLLDWAVGEAEDAAFMKASDGSVIRLHSADIAFYAQSALESAQLLLIAMLGAVPGEFRVHAIADLGWPVSLLDVALGTLAAARSRTPVYISGYDPGYEEVAFPGLYDPATAGDVSPLLNGFETAALVASPCPMVDSFRLEMAAHPAAPKLLEDLESAYHRGRCDGEIRQALDDLSWVLLDATLAAAAPGALARCANLTSRHESAMSPAHMRITRAIRAHTD